LKPKRNYKDTALDKCQTPEYGILPLLPYLHFRNFKKIWECASGDGILVKALQKNGFEVIATDLLSGEDFFYSNYVSDAIVTNPPFSLKYDWIDYCYELNKPWALLMPVETLGSGRAQKMFKTYGIEIMLLSRRINFKMPNKGWDSAAQFPVAWFTWKILPSPIVFGEINYEKN